MESSKLNSGFKNELRYSKQTIKEDFYFQKTEKIETFFSIRTI